MIKSNNCLGLVNQGELFRCKCMSGGNCPRRNFMVGNCLEGTALREIIIPGKACVPGASYSDVIVWRAKALGIIVLGVGSHWRQLSAG